MRKTLLVILLMGFIFIQGQAQSPGISVNSNSISATAAVGSSVEKTITITNTGVRDLTWSLSPVGKAVTFSKSDNADWNMEENQDRISENVWITRQDEEGIFNIAKESTYSHGSPNNTLWAWGNTSEVTEGDYTNWRDAVRGNNIRSFNLGGRRIPDMVGNMLSMRLPDENRYFNIMFHSWTDRSSGGGFSYTRTELNLPFISFSEPSGVILPGQSAEVVVVLNATNLVYGTYEFDLKITSNAPATPEILIPSTFSVTGGEGVVDAETSFDFGARFEQISDTASIAIKNSGTGVLSVSDIVSGQEAFVPLATSFELLPGQTYQLEIAFTPSSTSNFNGVLVLTTNNLDQSPFEIALTGSGIPLPAIEITHNELVFNLQRGESAVEVMSISNTGGSPLEYTFMNEFGASEDVSFSKTNYADWTKMKNQDVITSDVWLARGDDQGLFNAENQAGWTNPGPSNTKWAYGKTTELNETDYREWRNAVGSDPPGQVGKTISLYVETQKRYFDIDFTYWTENGQGGGFTYTRKEIYNWISYSEKAGSIAAGSGTDITLSVHATDLPAGTYEGNIKLSSNVPGQPDQLIPVVLNITGVPEVSAPAALDFGDGTLIGTSSQKTFFIFNKGTETLTISELSFDNEAYTLTSPLSSIAPQQHAEVTVSFSPIAAEAYPATLTLTSNDPVNPSLSIALSGKGAPLPSMSVTNDGLAVALGAEATSTRTITIENTGDGTLTYALSLEGMGEAVSFSKIDYANPKLTENQDRVSAEVWITRGDKQGLYNAFSEKKFDFDNYISPLGTSWGSTNTLNSSLTSYDEWINAIDSDPTESVGNVFSLQIPGENKFYDVEFTSWTSGDQGGGFGYIRTEMPGWIKTQRTSGTVAAGASAIVTLTFDAGNYGNGTYNSNLIISSNDQENSEVSMPLALTVSGGTPQIALDQTGLDFGSLYLTTSEVKTLKISNTSVEPLVINNLIASSDAFTADISSAVIKPKSSILVNVTFAPDAAQVYTETLTIESDDPDNSTITVTLTATGLGAPAAALTPNSLELQIAANGTETTMLSLDNSGEGALQWYVEETLEGAIAEVESRYTEITALVPNNHDFSAHVNGNTILEGSNMYSYNIGNHLSTNLKNRISYTGGEILEGDDIFGSGTAYFTQNLPGLFVMGAELNDISSFTAFGYSKNYSTGGAGSVACAVLEIQEGGRTYLGFVERVDNIGHPSINSLIIVEKTAGLNNICNTNKNHQQQVITDLNHASRIYYLLYSSAAGEYTDDTQTTQIMQKFLQIVQGANTPVSLDQVSGTVAPGASQQLMATLNFASHAIGNFSYNLLFNTNDPANPIITLPIYVEHGGLFVENKLADVRENEGFGTKEIDFTNVFNNNGTSTITYVSNSDQASVVTTSITGTKLTLHETGIGSALVTVRAEDGDGNVDFVDFTVWVNDTPKVANPLADAVEEEGFTSTTIDLSAVFTDADPLTYTVEVSNSDVVTTSLSELVLTVTEVGTGTATITITATDGKAEETESFDFRVNDIPVVANPIADRVEDEGFTSTTLDLSAVFTDADALNYTVKVSKSDVVTASISGSVLTITEAGTGTATITVAATDDRVEETDSFNFRVNDIPMVANALDDLLVNQGFGSTIVDLSEVFADLDTDDVLSYTVSSSDELVVTATLSGTIITIEEVGTGSSVITVTVNDGISNAEASDSFEVQVNPATATGINLYATSSVRLHPIPATDVIYLDGNGTQILKLNITDISGRQVFSGSFSENPSDVKKVDLGQLNPGVYIFEIQTSNGTESRKVILQ